MADAHFPRGADLEFLHRALTLFKEIPERPAFIGKPELETWTLLATLKLRSALDYLKENKAGYFALVRELMPDDGGAILTELEEADRQNANVPDSNSAVVPHPNVVWNIYIKHLQTLDARLRKKLKHDPHGSSTYPKVEVEKLSNGSVRIRRGPAEVILRGRYATIFLAVEGCSPRAVSWHAILKASLSQSGRSIGEEKPRTVRWTSPRSLERIGRLVRTALGTEFSSYWDQSGSGARWVPPANQSDVGS